MATLDQEDLDYIRAIVQDELKNDVNANTYVSRIDATISSRLSSSDARLDNIDATISSRAEPNQGLTIDEHNHLMSLENTDVAENTKISRVTLALSTKNNRRKK